MAASVASWNWPALKPSVIVRQTDGFKADQFHDATLAAIGKVNELLRIHFPANGSRANELPDKPLML